MKLKYLKITLAVICCLCLVHWGHTQSTDFNPEAQVPLVSPTAASLGKYVDFPVNLHTGVPNINLPLYTVEEGPLQLPISLSYHAGGLKVLEPAGWVGAGWTLDAGGVVSRTVKGLPDEYVGPLSNALQSDNSFYRD